MKTKTVNIVNFYELDKEWQEEAISNLDELARETMYLEPDIESNPSEHVLWDLSECIPVNGNYKGFEYNCSIGISNNTAMLLNIDDNMEECQYVIV